MIGITLRGDVVNFDRVKYIKLEEIDPLNPNPHHTPEGEIVVEFIGDDEKYNIFHGDLGDCKKQMKALRTAIKKGDAVFEFSLRHLEG